MNYKDIKAYIIDNKWMFAFPAIFIFIIYIFGYQFGKDMAQRENMRDNIQRNNAVDKIAEMGIK